MQNGCKRRGLRVDELTVESTNNNLQDFVRPFSHFRDQDNESFCVGNILLHVDTKVVGCGSKTGNVNASKKRPLPDDFELTEEDHKRCEAILSHHQEPHHPHGLMGRLRPRFSAFLHPNRAMRVQPV